MESREEPLTKRERAELQGYVSWPAVAVRALSFIVAVGAIAALSRRAQHWLGLPEPLWLLPAGLLAVLLYGRSRRWTGGRELRDRIQRDLEANTALVHYIRVHDAIIFEEREDEGPIVFVLTDAGETLAFTGQDLSRHVARGFPWREFEIRESATSRRFLRLKRHGEPFPPSAHRPPLSLDQFKQLGLSATGWWHHLDVPFDHLRQVA